MSKRSHHEGTVYQERSTGGWIAQLSAGYDERGKRRRIKRKCRTNTEALAKLKELQRQLDAGVPTGRANIRRIRRGGNVTTHRMTAQTVGVVIKKVAADAKLARPDELAAHSLRSGFATAAAVAGAWERAIANQTGHKSMQVLRRYINQATTFDDNAAKELGL